MAKFCEKCGAELPDDVKFCDKCGNQIKTNENNQSSSGVTYSCPYCGKTIPYSTRCPHCGKSLKNEDAKKAGIGIIGIIILLFLLVGIAGFLLLIFG